MTGDSFGADDRTSAVLAFEAGDTHDAASRHGTPTTVPVERSA
jgi:hypothetical protein